MDLLYENEAGDLDAVSFDCTISETFTATAAVTEHALESGASIGDHVRHSPDRVSLECFVSDSPATVPQSHLGGVTGSVQQIQIDMGQGRELVRGAQGGQAAQYRKTSQTERAPVLKFDGIEFAQYGVGRVVRVLGALRDLMERAVLVTCIGLAVELEDMVIVSLSAPKSQGDGESCTFRLELVRVLFATSETVDVPDPVEPRGARTADAGAVATDESTAPESIWHRVMGL